MFGSYIFIVLLLLTGCGSDSGKGKSNTLFPDYGLQEGDINIIEILTPDGTSYYDKTAVIDEGTEIQLSVTGTDVNGNKYEDVGVQWISNYPNIAIVDNSGKVKGISPGETTIIVTFKNENGVEIIGDIPVKVLPSPVTGKQWVTSDIHLPQPMWDHASAIWKGYLYVAGGNSGCTVNYQDCGFTDKVYYAPVNQDGSIGTFMATTPMPRILKGHAMVAYNNYMYIIGGIVNPVFLNPPYPCQVQDPLNNPYDPNNPNDIITSCKDFKTILNEKVYYATINPDGSITKWNETEALPPSKGIPIDEPEKAGLFALSATAHTISNEGVASGYIYVTGGWSAELKKNVDTVFIGPINKEDGSIMTWIHNEKSDLPYDLSKHASVTASVNGSDYLYIIGGNSGDIGSQVFRKEIYYAKIGSDGIIFDWEPASQTLPARLIDHAAVAAGRYIFVLGGRNGDGGSDDKTPYDMYRNVYYYYVDDKGDLQPLNRYPDMPEPLFHHAAATDINTTTNSINIYVTGGAGGNTEDPENRKDSVYYLTDTP